MVIEPFLNLRQGVLVFQPEAMAQKTDGAKNKYKYLIKIEGLPDNEWRKSSSSFGF